MTKLLISFSSKTNASANTKGPIVKNSLKHATVVDLHIVTSIVEKLVASSTDTLSSKTLYAGK